MKPQLESLKLIALVVISLMNVTIYSQAKDSLVTSNNVFKNFRSNLNVNYYSLTDTIIFLKYNYHESNFDKFQYVNKLQNMDFSNYGQAFSIYNRTLNLNDNYFINSYDFNYFNSIGAVDNWFLRPKDSFNPYGVQTIEDSIRHALTEDNILFAIPYFMYEMLK